jgi:hypothetical protein
MTPTAMVKPAVTMEATAMIAVMSTLAPLRVCR